MHVSHAHVSHSYDITFLDVVTGLRCSAFFLLYVTWSANSDGDCNEIIVQYILKPRTSPEMTLVIKPHSLNPLLFYTPHNVTSLYLKIPRLRHYTPTILRVLLLLTRGCYFLMKEPLCLRVLNNRIVKTVLGLVQESHDPACLRCFSDSHECVVIRLQQSLMTSNQVCWSRKHLKHAGQWA